MEARWLATNGYIQFTVPGGNERRSQFGSQTRDAAGDENSVLFTKKQMPEFESLRQAVEQDLHGAPNTTALAPPQPMPAAAPPQETPASRMAHLAELRDQGLITPDEYDAKRKEILDSI